MIEMQTSQSDDGLVDEQGPIPTFPDRQFDEHGRIIPISEEERRARHSAAIRALRAVDAMPDEDPPGTEEIFEMIYVLGAVDGGPLKIGWTNDLVARHRQLELLYSRKLRILATLQGGAEKEAEIFTRFAHLRFGKTEQFEPSPELLAFFGILPGALQESATAMEVAGRTKGRKLHLTDDVHQRLWFLARERKTSVSIIANELLDQSLPHFEVKRAD